MNEEANLYNYLSKLCKNKKIKIESFAELCELSRTTLYRYMKGILQIPPDVEARFIKVLEMSVPEQQELRRFISLNVFDSTLISSRYALDKFMFSHLSNQLEIIEPSIEFSFAFYENDSYLRNASEILGSIQKHSEYTNFDCKIRIINCIKKEIFSNTKNWLETILPISDTISAEHLLSFPKKDYLECTNTLIDIIPLLRFRNYNVFYNESYQNENFTPLMNNTILVEIHYTKNETIHEKYYILSYVIGGLSQCVSFDNKHLFRFFLGNYDIYKSQFSNSLTIAKDINALGNFFLDLETKFEQCLIKPNICYNKIPLEAYKSLFNRLSEEEQRKLSKSLGINNKQEQKNINDLFTLLQIRHNYAFKKGNIDVYSKIGLENLAKNGRLTDHIEDMPSFNPEELRLIFECLKSQLTQEGNDFKLYITEGPILENDCIISSFKNHGILIEYNEHYSHGLANNVFINHKMLSEVFYDYAENHIPAYHALSDKESVEFIEYLIEKYLTNF